MYFYQMDLQDYQRYVRNNSITDDLTLAILEDLEDISRIYENFIEVIEDFDLCTYNPEFLRIELKKAFDAILDYENEIENLKHENSTLQDEINLLKEQSAN
jgi:hypothetical protein